MSDETLKKLVLDIAVTKYFKGCNATSAIQKAIEDVKKQIGQDPREVNLEHIRTEVV